MLLVCFIIQKMSEILYQDNQVTIYKELIIIRKYYFPLATSKTIMISDIERVSLQNSEGVDHRWGVCAKYLNNWFPYDGNRKAKNKFIEIVVKGKKTRPSITPDDPDKAFQIIWQNFTPEGKAYTEHLSQAQDGKETELAREEMMKEEEKHEKHEESNQHLQAPQSQQPGVQIVSIDE